jgi:hypothetical protein
MKRLLLISGILSFSVLGLTLKAQERHQPGIGYNNGNGHYTHGNGNGYGHTGKATVGAPLDGGLLVVLGAAGFAYYSARRKRED